MSHRLARICHRPDTRTSNRRPDSSPHRVSAEFPIPGTPSPYPPNSGAELNPTPAELPLPLAVVGAGRLGGAIVTALHAVGVAVSGPHGRGYSGFGDAIVLLCVPDDAISSAATAIGPGPLVGHCSGVSGLDVLGAHEAFSLHPLMTVTRNGADLVGVFAAISGSTRRATAVATALATTLRLRPVLVAEADRVAYHAAAAFAANFLVTLETAAAELMSTAGLDREVLVPLARAALENWASQGPTALTGPIARGDQRTVARHRDVVESRTPDLLPLFEALVTATERMVVANRAASDRTAHTEIGSAGPTTAPQPSESTTP